jgi:hypothetical protein
MDWNSLKYHLMMWHTQYCEKHENVQKKLAEYTEPHENPELYANQEYLNGVKQGLSLVIQTMEDAEKEKDAI